MGMYVVPSEQYLILLQTLPSAASPPISTQKDKGPPLGDVGLYLH